MTHDAKGDPTALVVTADNKVQLRKLVTGQTYGTNWIIESGLASGDRVIVRGLQFSRPGMTVKPVDDSATVAPSVPTASKP